MTRKPVTDLAAVTIGFNTYLLPSAAALKVVTLMKDALECERSFNRHETYEVSEERPRIEMAIVRADQVRMPASAAPMPPARPRRLT